MSKLAAALLNVQKADIAIRKDGNNPAFRSKYATLGSVLEEVVPVLNAHGLVLMQFPTELGGLPALRTKLLHAESGEYEEDTMLLMLGKNDPQGQGSGLTYGRRYAALSILGLVADEDDDGNSASRSRAENGRSDFSPPPEVKEKLDAQASSSVPTPDGYDGSPESVPIPMGKHKGKALGDVPRNYVEWLAGDGFEPKTKDTRLLKNAALTILGAAVPAGMAADDDIPF